jgi:hypothetical protein
MYNVSLADIKKSPLSGGLSKRALYLPVGRQGRKTAYYR